MYCKDSNKWTKHADFIILDMICLQIAYIFAYGISGYGFNVYKITLYRNMAVFLELVDIIVIFTYGTMKNILKRGSYQNFIITMNHAVMIGALAIFYLFLLQQGQRFSRLTLLLLVPVYTLLTYSVKELRKYTLRKKHRLDGERKLLIISSKDRVYQAVADMQENNYGRYAIEGIAVMDEDWTGKRVQGIPVTANGTNVLTYVCQNWIDEVMLVISEKNPYPAELVDQLTQTGVPVHVNLFNITSIPGKKQFIEKIGNYTVVTTTLNYASPQQLMVKRLIDLVGGFIGCILTGIILIFIGPLIYMASPGPIFFAQERVGKNGRKFKMYKFRSMYVDAEARKAELMKDNKLGDGKMFKLDFDPRVIGNQILPDGTHKTGIGDFIRRTSLDEFPQFFNVLKGDMSLVGTRPPLTSETALYEFRHKARLAIKPGITGMWQVSGRSDITDFEEVVRLDKEYIENWNLGLDIKILLKTIPAVLKKSGSV